MPTRQDFQRLLEWCDDLPPAGWLKRIAGVALSVHALDATGSARPHATALMTGDISLRAAPGLSELPDEPVHFAGTLVGVRNPERRAQLSLRADAHHVVTTFSGDIPPAWTAGVQVQQVRDTSGLIEARWVLGDHAVGGEPPDEAADPQSFELLLWPSVREWLDLGPP